MPDQDVSNRRRGRKATRFAFSDEQRKVIDSYIPAFEKAVRDLNPDLSKSNDNLAKWKTATTEAIMDHDLFQDIEGSSSETRKKWSAAVRAIFSNHYSYNIVRKSAANPTTSLNATNVPRTLPHLRRALVTLTGDLSARDIFVDHLTEEEIEQAKRSVHETESTLVGGALRNAAIARLWQDADHDHWDQQKANFLSDTHGNQSEFPLLIAQSLQDICNSGRLGSVLLQLSYGFRGADDGVLSGIIFTGYDAQKRCEFNPVMKNNEEWHKMWEQHLDLQLPRHQLEPVNDIPKTEGGIPILPTIDVNHASMSELVQILQDYYKALWDYSHRSTKRKTLLIPWIEICNYPERHYDNATFNVPVRIRDPKEYLDDPADVFLLLKFFSNAASSGHPFSFLSFDSPSDDTVSAIPVPSPSSSSGGEDSFRNNHTSTPPPSSPTNNVIEASHSSALPGSKIANAFPPSALDIPSPKSPSLNGQMIANAPTATRCQQKTPSPGNTSPDVALAVTIKSSQKKSGQGLEALVPASGVAVASSPPLNMTSLSVAMAETVKVGKKKNVKGSKTGLEVPTLYGRDGETTKVGQKKGGKGSKTLQGVVALTSSTATSPSTNEVVPEASAASISTAMTSPAIGKPVSSPGPSLDVNFVAGPKRKRREVETGPEELGPRKRKATKRARGIEYNESTPSDEERRNEVAPARKGNAKQECKRGSVTG